MYDPTESIPTPNISLVSTKKIENTLPTVEVPYRLAILGEAPGEKEEAYGKPFIGPSGNFLDSLLSQTGILRQGCFVGNICKYRPPGNKIEEFGYDHPKVQEGWEELKDELTRFNPHAILALGNTPLHFLCDRTGILSWRGSILSSPYGKVVPSIHPAAVLREYKQWVFLRHDCLRARQESESPDLILPVRNLELNLTADEICSRLDNWDTRRIASFDIEGGVKSFPCCSVAGEPNRGFIIAWSRFTEEEQGRVACSLSRFLYRYDVKKVLQFGLYDRFVLAYAYNLLIRGVVDDTMLKHWEIYPESSTSEKTATGKKKKGLGKGLGVIASIWTREPFYKSDRKTEDTQTFYEYCIKDSCVTHEANDAMSGSLSPNGLRHYKFNVDLQSALLYMELRGMGYDQTTASTELNQVKAALSETASRLSLRAGYSLTGATGGLSSPKLKKCLYNEKGYPPQKIGRGPTAKVTTNVEALLNLAHKYKNDPFISDVLLHRKLESVKETLEVSTDPDGRVRCGYNLVGTETGRLACYTSPTGSGANLQTITKKLRKLYVADEDHWFFQCDLSGADGWTVAAHCLRHGDSTMWDDYHSGLKPARIIALMYEHGTEATNCTREELKEKCKAVDDDGWLYFACKRIQHASNYGVQEKTVSKQIMVDSYKITGSPVYVEPSICAILQRLYFVRYSGIFAWHHWCKREVAEGRNSTAASGHTRIFFGRRRSWDYRSRSYDADHDTWKEYLANEPQDNTTFATNMALHNLWNDPDNRDRVNGKGRFRVEPLHHMHDALCGQFHKRDTEWALQRIPMYFRNELIIANSKVIIPFDGAYGVSWGNLKQGVIRAAA